MRVGHVRLIGVGIAVFGIAAGVTATVAGGRWFGIGAATLGILLAMPRGQGNDAEFGFSDLFGGSGDSGGDGGGGDGGGGDGGGD